LNHEPLNTGSRKRYGLAFGEIVLMSSRPSRSQMCAGAKHQDFAESDFGGWADEKMKTVREAVLMLSPKKFHTQHLTISDRKHGVRLLSQPCDTEAKAVQDGRVRL